MKNAEEVARKLFIDLGNCPEFHQDNCSCFGKIAQALTAFAEERVSEEIKATVERILNEAVELLRAIKAAGKC